MPTMGEWMLLDVIRTEAEIYGSGLDGFRVRVR